MADPPEIGFMQGRMSPPVNGQIQAFPREHWREEFRLAHDHDFRFMEWTLDRDGLYDNPLMSVEGRVEIRHLMVAHNVEVPSLTGDCFMQAPFYKTWRSTRNELLKDLINVVKAATQLGIRIIVLPLVDEGSIETPSQAEDLRSGLDRVLPTLRRTGTKIAFESDFPPEMLASFIASFDARWFGVTYDIGNSAALGYDPREEIARIGQRVLNVHIKDRKRSGGTVPLTTGDADIPVALNALYCGGYRGPYVLQTARAKDGDHAGAVCIYRSMVQDWLREIQDRS